MSQYSATITWRRAADAIFVDGEFSRAHEWAFDGGTVVPASSSPDLLPPPQSVETNVDPEEAFVASLSSCHMLFFLLLAAKRKLVVDYYIDNPTGTMEKDARGRIAMTRVVLRPRIAFSGTKQPTRKQVEQLHHKSHDLCFIANSVRTEVIVEIPD